MTTLLFILETFGRMLFLSALLLLAYRLLVRGKADYHLCRKYLLAVPVLCLLIPAGQFAYEHLYEPNDPRELMLTEAEAREYVRDIPVGAAEHKVVSVGRSMVLPEATGYEREITAAVWGIAAISLLLAVLMGIQLLWLRARCRRMARQYPPTPDGIVRDGRIDTPFSFGRHIYLPAKRLTDNAERIIVTHEMAHIRLGHSAESLLMELFCRLLWFNPLVWIARKELRDVQEFEADRNVLESGAEIQTYQTLLLEEAMKDSPALAEGFNRSFVRRRFIEMRVGKRLRTSPAVRLTAILLAVCTTALASAGYFHETVVVRIAKQVEAKSASRAIAADGQPAAVAPSPIAEAVEAESQAAVVDTAEAAAPVLSDVHAPAAPVLTPKTTDDRPKVAEDGWPILYDLPVVETMSKKYAGVYMYHVGNETRLVFSRRIQDEDEFLKFGGPKCYVVDPATNVHYQARRSIPSNAWDHFHLRGMQGKRITVTVCFPRIPDSVKEIALYRVNFHLQGGERYDVADITDR